MFNPVYVPIAYYLVIAAVHISGWYLIITGTSFQILSIIAIPLLVVPFLLVLFFCKNLSSSSQCFFVTMVGGSAYAFFNFYIQSIWMYGPFHWLGIYGMIIWIIVLGYVLWWMLERMPETPFAAFLMVLVGLSLNEIMFLNFFVELPRGHLVSGSRYLYPNWVLVVSQCTAAILLDIVRMRKRFSVEKMGFLWGMSFVGLLAFALKLLNDIGLGPSFPDWKTPFGIEISWLALLVISLAGAFGGAIGFFAASLFRGARRESEKILTS